MVGFKNFFETSINTDALELTDAQVRKNIFSHRILCVCVRGNMAKDMIVLKSSDGVTFEVERNVIQQQSKKINKMIQDGFADSVIPLPVVRSETLSKVIEYCKRHVPRAFLKVEEESSSHQELKKFDKKFVDVSQNVLHDLITASHYLEIKSLFELTCQKAADMISGKTAEEIREIFNIVNDFTPEEEEEIRSLNARMARIFP